MRPIKPETGAPEKTMAENQEEYHSLPVAEYAEGVLLSRWRLNDEERERITNGEDLYIAFWTFGRPLQPVNVQVGPDGWEQEKPVEVKALARPGPDIGGTFGHRVEEFERCAEPSPHTPELNCGKAKGHPHGHAYGPDPRNDTVICLCQGGKTQPGCPVHGQETLIIRGEFGKPGGSDG